MKKLTKTQKQNLKKKLLRTFNIIGLIVGGLSFIVVLYAIIAGSLTANNSENTTAEVSEGSPSKPILEQGALTPPSSYDLELSPQLVGNDYYFLWTSSAGSNEALFSQDYAGGIDFYTNVYYFRGLSISTIVYAPTTPTEARPDDMCGFRGEYIGSSSSQTYKRFDIMLDNRNSKRAFLFYGDFSSSAYDVYSSVLLYNNNNENLGQTSNFTSYLSLPLRSLYVPPFSKLVLAFNYVSSAQYLDALYIDDFGSTAYDTGYDAGEGFGYNDGYYEGYDDGHIIGYNSGYEHGETYGYNDGYTDGYAGGIEDGSVTGYEDGYDTGYADGVAATTATTSAVEDAFDLIYAGAVSVDRILSISIFGSITLGMLLFTPVIIGISLAVIKIIKG